MPAKLLWLEDEVISVSDSASPAHVVGFHAQVGSFGVHTPPRPLFPLSILSAIGEAILRSVSSFWFLQSSTIAI